MHRKASGELRAAVSFFSTLGGFLHLTHLQDSQDWSSDGQHQTPPFPLKPKEAAIAQGVVRTPSQLFINPTSLLISPDLAGLLLPLTFQSRILAGAFPAR